MSRHDCPGLAQCINHPRWRVTVRRAGSLSSGLVQDWPRDTCYYVWPPGIEDYAATAVDYSVAVAYASERARADMVAAVQNGAGR